MEAQLTTESVLDPLAVLAFAAARTRSIRLGVAVLVLPVHQPVLLARSLATLDTLSGGRVIAGLGAGGGHLPFEAFGVRAEERRGRLEEYVAALRALWTGEPASLDGRYVTLRDAVVRPAAAGLPIWLGGGSRPALRRAARIADGWIAPGGGSTADFAQAAAHVRELAAQAGRTLTVGKRVYVAIDRSRDCLSDWLDAIYRGSGPDPGVVAAGSVAAVTERLLEVREAGAEHLIAHPVGGEERAQLEALAEHVLPALTPRRADAT